MVHQRGHKQGRSVRQTSGAVVTDPDAWVDGVDLDSPNATLDTSSLLAVYSLNKNQCCSQLDTQHRTAPCSAPRCLMGAVVNVNHSASMTKFIDRLMGPRPEELDQAAPPSSVNEDANSYSDLVPAHRGLKNLGNTCYLNCVVQLVFHDPELRRHIVTSSLMSNEVEQSGLAWIFLQLAFARHPAVDASPLVSYFQIDRRVQQDAQEFLGLLLQWLQEVTHNAVMHPSPASSSSSSLTGLDPVQQLLEGVHLYSRKCPQCGNEAKKVEPFWFVSVRPRATLAASLDALSVVEDVEGFQCGKCNQTVTAQSTLEWKRLPHTLLIHLTRFQYDASQDRRVKLDDAVVFPTALDMSRWASGLPLSMTQYTLEGVVNHVGSTPQSGHYTYHSKMQGDDVWYSYDDADVTKLRRYSGDTASSREAYVLVYRRRPFSGSAATTSLQPLPSDFPPTILGRLREYHKALEEKHRTWATRRDIMSSTVKEWGSLVDSLITAARLPDNGPLYFVNAAWYRCFLSMFTQMPTDCTVPSSLCVVDVDNDDESTSSATIVLAPKQIPSFYPARCVHNKLRVDANFKAVSEASFVELFSRYGSDGPAAQSAVSSFMDAVVSSGHASVPLSTENGLCMSCAVAHGRRLQEKRQSAAKDAHMRQLALVSDVSVGRIVAADTLDVWLQDDCVILAPQKAAHDNEDANDGASVRDLSRGLVCPHGMLSPVTAHKVISADVFCYLVAEKGFICSKDFTITSASGAASETCPVCIQESVSATSVRHGVLQRKLHESKQFVVFQTDEKDINKAVWKRDIATYTKKFKAAWHAEQAKLAAAQKEAETKIMEGIKIVHTRKSANGDAATSPSTPASISDAATPPQRRFDYYGVPTAWVDSWRRWYKDSTASVECPPRISTEPLLCPHGGLLHDVNDFHVGQCAARYPQSSVKPVCYLLSKTEYDDVLVAYGPVIGPTIVFSEVDDARVVTPTPCDACVSARIAQVLRQAKQFYNSVIRIEGKVRKSKKQFQEIAETFGGVDCSATPADIAARLSTRILERHSLFVSCDDIFLTKSKKHFQQAVLNGSQVAEVLDAAMTLEDLGVEAQSTLYFVIHETAARVESHQQQHFDPAVETTGLTGRNEEITFASTKLSGLSAAVGGGAHATENACSVCTYINPLHAKNCEMCESPL